VELRRFSEHLGVPLTLQPRFFPTDAAAAARLIVAVDAEDGAEAAMRLSGAMLRAVWAEERNLAAEETLQQLLTECGLPTDRLAVSDAPEIQHRYEANTQQAMDAGVFGAPSYVVDGEIFWGQDRLEFLQRRLDKLSAASAKQS
jgi:2-hydroxychromene-2-carboxylate isomerase